MNEEKDSELKFLQIQNEMLRRILDLKNGMNNRITMQKLDALHRWIIVIMLPVEVVVLSIIAWKMI